MDVFLGRNSVSGPRTLKPKKPKKPKNLKNFFKNLGFFQPWYLQSDAFYRHSYYIGRNRTP